MTPADLSTWRQHMALTQRAAAAALGVSLPTYQQWERGSRFDSAATVEIDRRTALACAALAAGMSEWTATTATATAATPR